MFGAIGLLGLIGVIVEIGVMGHRTDRPIGLMGLLSCQSLYCQPVGVQPEAADDTLAGRGDE